MKRSDLFENLYIFAKAFYTFTVAAICSMYMMNETEVILNI